MLDIQFIRENPQKAKDGIAAKQYDSALVDDVLILDTKRRELIASVESLRAEKNKAADSKNIEEGKRIKEELKRLEPRLNDIEKKFQKALFEIPNLPAEDVKVGKDESENEVIKTWGEPKKFDFQVRDHLELGEKLGIIDVKAASRVSGARFTYLLGDAVLLELALVNFAMDVLIKAGFIPIVPPALIKRESMEGTGHLEHGGEGDMFALSKDNLFLIGTSEQSIGPMRAGEVLKGKDLPLRYVGFSTSFRREAGSYGKDTRGIMRVHQFDKVEMFSYSKPSESDKEHEYLLEIEENFFQALGLPYQVVKMVSGDLGHPVARKYDINVWIPSQNKYRELTSTSTTTDFQARRLDIKFEEKGQRQHVHTLNGTAFAIGRTLIAILENYQQKDGSVMVPEVLRKWVGKEKIKQ